MWLHRVLVGLEEMLPVNWGWQTASSNMNSHSGVSAVLRRSVSNKSMVSPSWCDMCIVEKLLTNTEGAETLSSWTRISWRQGGLVWVHQSTAQPEMGMEASSSLVQGRYLFLYFFGCPGPLLLHVAFFGWGEQELLSSCGAWASHCRSFSLWSMGSRMHGLHRCGKWVELPPGMWDLPRWGIEHVSPELAGGFPITEPAGKSPRALFLKFKDASLGEKCSQWFPMDRCLILHKHC